MYRPLQLEQQEGSSTSLEVPDWADAVWRVVCVQVNYHLPRTCRMKYIELMNPGATSILGKTKGLLIYTFQKLLVS